MIKVGIIGGETVSAGELIRLLVNHPDVHLMLVASEEHAGMPVTAVHRGLEGDTDLRFCASLSADEAARNLSAVFICGEPWQARQFVEAVDALPTGEPDDSQRHDEDDDDRLRIIDLTGAYRNGERGMVYGLPEHFRKPLVRGATRAAIPSAVAMGVGLALLPLARNSAITGRVTVTVSLASTEMFAASSAPNKPFTPEISTRFDPVAPAEFRPDAEHFAAEITAFLREVMPAFAGQVSLKLSRTEQRRGVAVTVDVASSMTQTDVRRAIDTAYDDHAFAYRVDHLPDVDEALNTNKCLLYVCDPRVPDDLGTASSATVAEAAPGENALRLVSVSDNLLKGAAGTAVHCMNLLFGLSERTGLALKSSAI